MSDTLIVIRSDSGTTHKISKICSYKGGFAALVPYHSARQGFLMKHPVMTEPSAGYMSMSDVVPYTADDQVKLSVHLDGFAQFSGVNSSKIVSGFDTAAGEPKGLGVKGDSPIPASTTGPPFNITLWGIEDFDVLKGHRKGVCEFAEGDFYARKG